MKGEPNPTQRPLSKARKSIARLFALFGHDPKEEPFLDPSQRLAKDTNFLSMLVGVLFFAGMIVAAAAAWHAWAGALLLGFAFFAAALLFGFLFGIPKSVSESAAPSGSKVVAEAQLAVNTNLEQISDWLTKIIVGLGLVELKVLPSYLDRLMTYVSPVLVNSPDAKSICTNLFMYFSSLGFLTGWVGTRVFLSPLIDSTDKKWRKLPEAAKADLASAMAAPTVNVEKTNPPETTQAIDDAAKAVITAAPALEQLTDANDIVAWAQAQLALGDFPSAVRAYQKALQLNPKDIRVRLGLGVCYYASGRPIEAALSELLAAQALIASDTDAATKIAIYENLAAAYLYTDPPGGYQTALDYIDRALALKPPSPANLYLYAAAAMGQQYLSRKRRGEPEPDLESSRQKMLEFARQAVEADPSMKDRLWDLASEPSSIDNDLAPFADDPDFLTLVGRGKTDELQSQ
jgi:tetratricopeptide (TPR) repeat protein